MKIFIMGFWGILLSATVTFAADCTERFSWLPNTEADVAGYKIHYGLTDGGPYPDSVDVGNLRPIDGRIVADLSAFACDEHYYVVVNAYNSAGLESDYSTQVELLVTAPADEPYPILVNITSN